MCIKDARGAHDMKESYKDNGTFKNGFLGRPFSVIIGLLLVAAGLAASFIIIANFDILCAAALKALALFVSAASVTVGIFFLGMSIINK